MKATDLRIGNYVNTRIRTFEKYEVDQITASGIMDMHCNGDDSSIEYTPIPLTEDWLLSFGFSINEGEYHRTIKENWLYLVIETDNSYALYSSQKALDNAHECCGEYLDHVHQLQNLIFALTGKELKRVEE